jgi:hypothetical protein
MSAPKPMSEAQKAALWDTLAQNACVQTDEDGGVWIALYVGDAYEDSVAGLTEEEHRIVREDSLPQARCAPAITRMVEVLQQAIARGASPAVQP